MYNIFYVLVFTYFLLVIIMMLKEITNNVQKEAESYSRRVCFCDKIRWRHFNDGFPDLFIDDVKAMAGKDGQQFIVYILCIKYVCFLHQKVTEDFCVYHLICEWYHTRAVARQCHQRILQQSSYLQCFYNCQYVV